MLYVFYHNKNIFKHIRYITYKMNIKSVISSCTEMNKMSYKNLMKNTGEVDTFM